MLANQCDSLYFFVSSRSPRWKSEWRLRLGESEHHLLSTHANDALKTRRIGKALTDLSVRVGPGRFAATKEIPDTWWTWLSTRFLVRKT